MKKLIIIPFLLLSTILYSQAKTDTVSIMKVNSIENTKTEIENLKHKLDFQQMLDEKTVESISNQLNAASYNLTLFGILITILGVILGVYVTIVENKVIKIREENKEMLAESQKIREEVRELKDIIKSDIHKLFVKIKREEIDYILNRLIKVPDEIQKVGYSLLSSELQPENFSKLRQAYLNSDTSNPNDTYHWEKLFIRHFITQTLNDERLRADFSVYITHIFSSALDNEIDRFTYDFTTVLVDNGILKYKEEVNHFFLGLTSSKYKRCNEITKLLFDNLKTRKNRFDTFNVIDSAEEKRKAKISFGNLLHNEYFSDHHSASEELAFDELDKLNSSQQGEEQNTESKTKGE